MRYTSSTVEQIQLRLDVIIHHFAFDLKILFRSKTHFGKYTMQLT